MFATRQAGVLLLAAAVLLPCGIWTLAARPSVMGYVLLFGFCFAAAPIALALPQIRTTSHRGTCWFFRTRR